MTYRCVTIWQLNDNFRPIFQIVKVGRKNSINKSTEFRNFKIHSIATKFQLQIRNETAPRSYLKSNNAIIDRQGNEKEYTTNRENCCVHYAQLSYFRSSAFNPVKSCSEERKVGFEARQFQSWKSQREQRRCPFFPPFFSLSLSLFPPFSLSKPYWYRGIIRERDLDPLDSKGCHDAPVYIGILNRFYSTTRNRLTRHNGRLENDFPPSPWKGPNHHHNRLTTFEQFDPREKLYTTITFSTGARGGTCAFGDNRRTSGSLQRTRID